MIRRTFLGLSAAVGGLAALRAAEKPDKKIATYKVEGFWCPTCSVGLETLLTREKGILTASATYPEGRTVVTYDARHSSPAVIAALIESMGFRPRLLAAPEHS